NNYNSGGPSYSSAEAIIDEELEANEHRSRMNSSQTNYAPEPLSRSGSSMQYSEEEKDEAFGKVITDKKKNAVVTVQNSTTPEKCNDSVSHQKDDGSFEISDTVCEEIDVPVADVPWWKTALTLSYLKVAAPHHKKLWEDKEKKAREYLSKQIGDAAAEKELLDCANKYVKDKSITIVQDAASPDKCQEIVSKQKNDGSIELDDSVCKELDDDIITTFKKKITNTNLQLPEYLISLGSAINLAYLKNAASSEYNKAHAEEELIKCADNYVVDKVTDKVIEEGKQLYETVSSKIGDISDQIGDALTFDIDKHDDLEALIIVEESATPEKCKEVVSGQKYVGSIELCDTVCDKLDIPKEEIITTIHKNIKNNKLKLPECADNYVIDHSIKKVIKDKKKNAVAKLQDSTTPEKCNDVISNQKDDGSFEVSETICKEIDIPIDVKETQNEKLKSPKSEPWWKTALTLSYLKFAAPDHKKNYGNIKIRNLVNIFLNKLEMLKQKKNTRLR
ncbi:19540_t:CDS:2, partial [Gigaspora rosea]